MKDEKIYTPEGWLDIDYIVNKYPAWLYVIVSLRQVGKTYGVLKYLLKNDIKHVLIRRTRDEMDLIKNNPDLDPYKPLEDEGFQTTIISRNGANVIADYIIENKKIKITKERGLAFGLPTLAHIRGFSGKEFTDVLFDEFIPEKGVIVKRAEGVATLNAYTTINGNRELKGEKPLRLWMLANANSAGSPIARSFGLVEILQKGEEVYYDEKLQVCVLMPTSEKIAKKRAETKLMTFLRETKSDEKFYAMAMKNEFSYDDLTNVKKISLKGFQPFASFNNEIFIWRNNDIYYVCSKKHNKNAYKNTEADIKRINEAYKPLFHVVYSYHNLKFEAATLFFQFKELFGFNYDIL